MTTPKLVLIFDRWVDPTLVEHINPVVAVGTIRAHCLIQMVSGTWFIGPFRDTEEKVEDDMVDYAKIINNACAPCGFISYSMTPTVSREQESL